jgi:hypothetical protein
MYIGKICIQDTTGLTSHIQGYGREDKTLGRAMRMGKDPRKGAPTQVQELLKRVEKNHVTNCS